MINTIKKYCDSLTRYQRYKTREVFIGNIPLGRQNPIRIQSMTTTNTMDTKATVEQTIRMVNAGCEYVRITAPSINDAQNLSEIKKELRKRGYNVPLIADIHFTPNAAEIAARIVEKVRVNPGNYADRKKFQQIEYTDNEYNSELDRIRERFIPLVKVCKEYGTAMRIGTNHGSLSDRIMSRYGDTPLGMVESALEFVRICEDLDYFNIVLSMKASNPQIMVQAYRLLVYKMEEEGMNYPLHLGVTEAGDGEDGRIKSAMGIGTLLEDGLGDTIRVSLTEEPEYEAPVVISLAKRYESKINDVFLPPIEESPVDPFAYKRRITFNVSNIGGTNIPVVFAEFSKNKITKHKDMESVGYFYLHEIDKWNMNDTAVDYIYLGNNDIPFEPPQSLKIIYDYNHWNKLDGNSNTFPLYTFEEYLLADIKSPFINFVRLTINQIRDIEKLKNDHNVVFIIESENSWPMIELRRLIFELIQKEILNPAIIKIKYQDNFESMMLYSSIDFGALFIDGLGDGIWIENNSSSKPEINRLTFGILQAARLRISKTEYIACPSCGRTLFDLQEITNKIRNKTGHLKGVKIAIMGCIVNGPGEMADADYGYVGSGIDKITLYRGKNIVKRNLNSEFAVDELINLIKEDNNWIEPLDN